MSNLLSNPLQVGELFTHAVIVGRNFPICHVRIDGLLVEVSSLQPGTSPHVSTWTTPSPREIAGPFKLHEHNNSSTSRGACIPRDAAAIAKQLSNRAGWSSEHLQLQQQQQQPVQQAERPWQKPCLHQEQQGACQQHQSARAMTWTQARRANARSRDFTVNALLYDPFTLLLYDYVGGVTDLELGVVRCVRGAPNKSLQQDPARILRAIRCAARTGGCLGRQEGTTAIIDVFLNLLLLLLAIVCLYCCLPPCKILCLGHGVHRSLHFGAQAFLDRGCRGELPWLIGLVAKSAFHAD